MGRAITSPLLVILGILEFPFEFMSEPGCEIELAGCGQQNCLLLITSLFRMIRSVHQDLAQAPTSRPSYSGNNLHHKRLWQS